VKDSIITKPLAIALSAIRRLQQFTRAEITKTKEEWEEISKARAALLRAGRFHATRIGLAEKWVERIIVDGDIELPAEEIIRALLDFSEWMIDATNRDTEQIRISAKEVNSQVRRFGRQWAKSRGLGVADLDERLLKGARHGRG
jgi:hypothetical protein